MIKFARKSVEKLVLFISPLLCLFMSEIALLNEEERPKTRNLKAGFAAAATKDTNPDQNKRCPCGFPRDRCWICDASKHPSLQTCKDCNQSGHYSSGSYRCQQNRSKKANAILGKEDDMDWENKVPKPKHLDRVLVVNNHPFPTKRGHPTSNFNCKKRNRFHLKVDTNPRLRK